ncbi:MAG: LapA family protein [Chitinispirillales bacterium]|jgi:uncharacterized membrane protein YciS (DUF1049 family)|nr:LapA family protein [Chitinispirillales bacterium]
MRILKWCLVFAIAFAVAWIFIFTFTQPQFSASAPIRIFGYVTAEFPIYIFIAAALGIGLFIGFIAAGYYYFSGQAGIRHKKKEIKKLTDTISVIEAERDQYRAAAKRERGKDPKSGSE